MFQLAIPEPVPIARPVLRAVETDADATDADATDERLVAMWLHGKSPNTQRAYRRTIKAFSAFSGGKPLRHVTLGDLQGFADSLGGKLSSQAQTLAAIRSLLTFAAKLGAIPFNAGAVLEVPKSRDGLADRIICEGDVQQMIACSLTLRDRGLVRLAYAGAFRVSELTSLRWSDINATEDGGAIVTVFGKGRKTRFVRISGETIAVIAALRKTPGDDTEAVFAGKSAGTTLSSGQAWRIVRAAAKRAGIVKPVSPHFLRHAHASHALDRGAPIVLVRDTLGHASVATTDRYLHARPGESSGKFLAV